MDIKKSQLLEQWRNRKKDSPKQMDMRLPEGMQAPLSFGQESLLFLQKMFPGNPFYNYAETWSLKGDLNVDHLLSGIKKLVERHAILKTTFRKENGDYVQTASTEKAFGYDYFDLAEVENDKKQVKAEQLALHTARQAFDLENGPLLHITVLRFGANEHIVVVAMHHIVADKWSMDIFRKEVADFYKELKYGDPAGMDPLPVSYADFSFWKRRREKISEKDLQYWKEKLSGELPRFSLAADHLPPETPSFNGAIIGEPVSKALSEKLKELGKTQKTTTFVLLLTAFKIFLQRYSGESDLLVGTPVSNRDRTELQHLIGFFNDTIVIRTQPDAKTSFSEYLGVVNSTFMEAFSHRNVPFAPLVKAINPERSNTSNPFFQVMFLFDKVPQNPDFGPGLEFEYQFTDLGVSKFDLTLSITEDNDRFHIAFEYTTDLYKEATVQRMLQNFKVLLNGIAENPQIKICDLPLLSEKEYHQVIAGWNTTFTKKPEFFPLHELINQRAQENPDASAVSDKDQFLSYSGLIARANIIAGRLLDISSEKGELIGLYCDRSIDMFTGILGILKAGKAYVPIDPAYPDGRISFILEDASVKVIVQQKKLRAIGQEASIKQVFLDDWENVPSGNKKNFPEISPEDPAYVIYTSGSTGNPKGVVVSHSNLFYSTSARQSYYPKQPGTFLLLSSFAFDSSVAGIFWTLCSGGHLVIPPRRIEQDIQQLAGLVRKHSVTHTLLLPSLYALLLEHASNNSLDSLNTVIVAGEACPVSLPRHHFEKLPGCSLYNEYGPTESTVWCTAHEIRIEDAGRQIPIGRPIDHYQIYILDPDMNPTPIGVPGELYVGGPGITAGYLNRPDLTERSFVPDSFTKGENKRLYRTGDLARYRDGGIIDFLGRVDHQVKIRGYRIEPDEIREVILKYGGIREAEVIAFEETEDNSGQKQLAAYYSSDRNVDPISLKKYLKERLPDYMVPAFLIELDVLPRLPNGKIDRKAFPKPSKKDLSSEHNYVAPVTSVQEKLVVIWEEILNVKPIGINDNFFACGGDSIKSIQMIAKAREVGLTITPDQPFRYQTIAELAASVVAKKKKDEVSGKKDEKPSSRISDIVSTSPVNQNPDIDAEFPLSPVQEAYLFHHLFAGDGRLGFIQISTKMDGCLDKKLFTSVWQETVERHAALRTRIKWEGQKSSTQVVMKSVDLLFSFIDFSHMPEAKALQEVEKFQTNDREKGFDLSVAPLSRIGLLKTGEKEYYLIWSAHHIILDGWSWSVLFKEVFETYNHRVNGTNLILQEPRPFSNFIEWLSSQDESRSERFWKNALSGLSSISRISKSGKTSARGIFKRKKIRVSKEITSKLIFYARAHKLTLNTLVHGSWALLLNRYTGMEDVVFGQTVSGRSIDLEGVESIIGMFTNSLPVRLKVNKDMAINSWLGYIFREQMKALPFEQTPLHKIQQWSGIDQGQPLFESLVIMQNYQTGDFQSSWEGQLDVKFSSHGIGSAYPLTIMIMPEDSLVIHATYDELLFKEPFIEGLLDFFRKILEALINPQFEKVGDMNDALVLPVELSYDESQQSPDSNEKKKTNYVPPGSEIESRLCSIWEEIFDKGQIGVNDNFFDIGGRSLLAVRMFAKIDKQLGRNIAPITLLQYPTIRELALFISGDGPGDAGWSSLVPLRSKGTKTPLFCIHAGLAHVFFYEAFTNHLHEEQPVYAIQPSGLKDPSLSHSSIEAMAAHYISEIKKVQPTGPYAFLSICYGDPINLEMSRQLQKAGEEAGMVIIVDSGPEGLFAESSTPGIQDRVKGFFDRLMKNPLKTISKTLEVRMKKAGGKLKETIEKTTENRQERNLRIWQQTMVQAYREYSWASFNGDITFIRTRESIEGLYNKEQLEAWKKIVNGKLNTHAIEGHHRTIFQEPEVRGLAKKVQECLDAFFNKEA